MPTFALAHTATRQPTSFSSSKYRRKESNKKLRHPGSLLLTTRQTNLFPLLIDGLYPLSIDGSARRPLTENYDVISDAENAVWLKMHLRIGKYR